MTEWSMVLVLGTLVSLGVALVKPIVSLNTSVSQLIIVLDRLQKDFQDLSNHNHIQDGQLEDL